VLTDEPQTAYETVFGVLCRYRGTVFMVQVLDCTRVTATVLLGQLWIESPNSKGVA